MRFEPLEKGLDDPQITGVVQIAPAVRVSLGELFGYEAGTVLTKKVVGALKELGFDYVFDTSFGADVAVMEETKEFEQRFKEQGPFPVINSCCPGTVSFLEHAYPDLVHNIATVKSPMEVAGSLVKTYFAEKKNLDPDKILSVAVMPCVIKKAEALKPELRLNGELMIDGVLTTMELSMFMNQRKVDLRKVKEREFDSLMGTASGAGQIFGSSGGVSESALRNFAYLNNVPIEKIETKDLRGSKGVREILFRLNGQKIKVAIVNSLRYAHEILNKKNKLKKYHFIEIMACLGGCVGGAGQPPTTKEAIEKRRKGLYNIDSGTEIKVAAQNPELQKLYTEYLGEVGGKKSRELLHTSFAKICEDCF